MFTIPKRVSDSLLAFYPHDVGIRRLVGTWGFFVGSQWDFLIPSRILARKHGSEPILSNDYGKKATKIRIPAIHIGIFATNMEM